MTKETLAKVGNVIHVYDFRVKPGKGDEFIAEFNKYAHLVDYG